MAKVELRQGESQEQLLRRFRKQVVKSQVLSSARRKRWHVSKSELKRIKMKKAQRRAPRERNCNDHGPRAVCHRREVNG